MRANGYLLKWCCGVFLIALFVGEGPSAFGQVPHVTNATPVQGASDVAHDEDVVAWFDQVMDGSTIYAETFKVYSSFYGRYAAGVSFNAATNQATLNPLLDFYPGERVFAELSKGITNAAGTDELPYQVWSFRAETAASSGLLGNSSQSFGLTSVYNVQVGDLNRDGDLDIITCGLNGNGLILTNDGTGQFSDSGQDLGNNRDVAIGDLNGDLYPDLFCGGTTVSRVYTNDGSGSFTDTGQSLANNFNHGVVLADFNGDGDLDAFTMNQYDHCKVWTNDGTGMFYDSGQVISTNTLSGCVGDLTGNGYIDVVVSGRDGVRVYTNDGNGIITYDGQELISADSYNPDMGDVNGDGYLDVLVARYGGDSRVFTNDGNGVLSATGQNMAGYNITDGKFGDMNGDGLLDVVLFGISFGTYVYTNDGNAMFYENDHLSGGSGDGSMALGDLDGDGDLDVARGHISSPGLYVLFNQYPALSVLSASDALIENDANTALSLGTDFGDIAVGATRTNHFAVTNDAGVLLSISGVTTNGDGADNFIVHDMPKVLTGGVAQVFSISFHPDALGVATAQVTIANSSTNGAYVINLTGAAGIPIVTNTVPGNADVDVLQDDEVMAEFDAPVMASTVTTNTLLLYSGQSGFKYGVVDTGSGNWNATLTPTASMRPGELLYAGVTRGVSNLAGTVDVKPYTWSFYAAAAGRGDLLESTRTNGTSYGQSIALGDLDNDGDLDALVVNFNHEPDEVWTNDGTGVFYNSGQSLGGNDGRFSALGDVNKDGYLDAFVANYAEGNRVWLNDGTGQFIDSGQVLGSANSRHVSLADLNGDGSLDAYCINQGQADQVYTNDGAGTFYNSGQSLSSASGLGAMLGDVNNDGALDVFVAVWNAPDEVWTNDGVGVFYNSGQSLSSGASRDVGLGDVNGDGYIDAFVANDSGQANSVWLNNGSGSFIDSGQALGAYNSRGVALGDLDGDGDLDGYVGNFGQANVIWLNDGSGTFVQGSTLSATNQSWHVSLGDVDGDGALDVAVADQGASFNIDLNQTPGLTLIGLNDEVIENDAIPTAAHGNDFGDINQGEITSHTLTLTNAGAVDLMIQLVATNGAHFSLVVPAQVDAGTVSNVVLQFDAQLPGVFTADFVIENNSSNSPFMVNANARCLPPRVTNSIPASAQIGVDMADDVYAQFSTNMLVSSITSNTFFLRGEQSGDHQGTVVVNGPGTEAALTPDGAFFAGERVFGNLPKGITNQAGSIDMRPHTWSFKTAVEPGGGSMIDHQAIGSWAANSLEVGDLNNDGWVDVIMPMYGSYSRVLLNDGSGNLTTNQSFGRWIYPWDIALGDVDRDGDLDAFIVCADHRADQVWTNDGSGTIYDSGQRLGTNDNHDVALGDVDGDGDLDAFLVTDGDMPNSIWLNDGSGTFVDSGQVFSDSDDASDVVLLDLDNDGDLDAFESTHATNVVWINNGQGVFASTSQPFGDDYTFTFAAGDINGDGYLDIVTANGWDDELVWFNDGAAGFTNDSQRFPGDYCTGVDLGDLDGDGDLDLMFAYGNITPDRIYWNDGNGVFLDSGQRMGNVSANAVKMADFNNDGRLDFYVIDVYSIADHIWLNTLPDVRVLGMDGEAMPSDAAVSISAGTDFGYLLVGESVTHVFAITNAGAGDLWISEVTTNGWGADYFAISNVPGCVTAGTVSNFNITYSATISGVSTAVLMVANSSTNMTFLMNLQGGGCDTLLTNTVPEPATVGVAKNASVTGQYCQPMMGSTLTLDTFMLRGQQTGLRAGAVSFNPMTNEVTFDPAVDFMPGELVTAELTHGITNASGTATDNAFIWRFFADVDGGSAYLTNSGMSTCDAESYAAALGDVDNDGDLDVYIAVRGAGNQVWTNDGTGLLVDSGQRLGTNASRDVALGDLDNDGDLDAFVVNKSEPDRVWTNNGTGLFFDGGLDPAISAGLGVCLGDLNGDGWLDAYEIAAPQANHVWTNDRSGVLHDSGQSLGTADSRGLCMGDVDNDGDLDVFVVNADSTDYLWWNDGNAVFTNSTAISTNNGRHAAFGDLNGDGSLDLFVCNLGDPDRVWTNDGAGQFYDTGQRITNLLGRGVALGDLNDDGALDAFIVNRAQPNMLYLNDGTGNFIDSGLSLGSAYGWWPSLGDLDGDGDLDVYVPVQDAADEVWFNAQLYTILATCNSNGSIMPSGVVEVIDGQSTSFVVTASEYYHIEPLLTNGAVDTAADGLAVYTSEWNNVTATGAVHAAFSADLAALGTPCWWLASYGLTNGGASFDQAEVADSDSDQFSAGNEFIADTDPTNNASYFAVVAISNAAGYSVFFHSSSIRNYSMEYSDQLVTGAWLGVAGQTNQPGIGGPDSLSDTNETGSRAYRLGVRLP